MTTIRQILRHSLLLVATLFCSCEQDRLSDMPNVREGETVEVRLDMKASEMMQVQTRATADDEIAQDGIYALVFDASNKLLEVVKANAAAGGYTVKLASSSSGRKVVVVANAAEAIKKVIPKLMAKEWTYDGLRAEILAPELPHTGTPGNADCRITAMPTQHSMTGSIELPAGINSATVINSTGVAGGDPLLLSRNTVKITVAINTATGADPSLADLTLEGANLASAPLTAQVLPALTEEVLSVFPTGHYVGTGGTLSDMMVGAVAGGKSTEPLCCYAASNKIGINNNGTCVVVKATYKGEICYYRLDLRNAAKVQELKGNNHYTVRISKVETKGYATPEEAMANVASNNIETIVVDPSANYIVSEGYSYLGLSRIQGYRPLMAAETTVVVSTVIHNIMGANTIGAITVEGNGLSLINGADLPPSTDGSIQKKDIEVSFTEAFVSGKVIINLGGKFTQTIVITTSPLIIIGNIEIARADLTKIGAFPFFDWATAMGRNESANGSKVGTTMGDKPTGCNTLYAGTGKKWRVPTLDELKNMYTNKAAIEAKADYKFRTFQYPYWSATEFSSSYSYILYFQSGSYSSMQKSFFKEIFVRCVRDL